MVSPPRTDSGARSGSTPSSVRPARRTDAGVRLRDFLAFFDRLFRFMPASSRVSIGSGAGVPSSGAASLHCNGSAASPAPPCD